MLFKDLDLLNEIQRAVAEAGYNKPTPIQEKAIPIILSGSDLMAGAQTGTGKTAGFTLPLLQQLMKDSKKFNTQSTSTSTKVRALILTPTRELAAQVGESAMIYGKYLPLKSTVIFGGVSIDKQIKSLRSGVDIVVATPGRLLDHVSQRTIDLSKVEILVLDEADRMLDMGFIHDIRKIINLLPKKRQNLLFSATFSPEIKKLASSFLVDPQLIETVQLNKPTDLVTQTIYPVDNKNKRKLLIHLISTENWRQVLVFARTKHGADKLAHSLKAANISAAAIHGNKTQSARTRVLADFKNGNLRVLVATDIAARGLDIEELPFVVNFELPNVPEDYVHRIGRTGRAGNLGKAVSLVCINEHKLLQDIEKLIKKKIPQVIQPGFEEDPSIKAEPIHHGRGGNHRQNTNTQTRVNTHVNTHRNSTQRSNQKPNSNSNSDSNLNSNSNQNSHQNANANSNSNSNANKHKNRNNNFRHFKKSNDK